MPKRSVRNLFLGFSIGSLLLVAAYQPSEGNPLINATPRNQLTTQLSVKLIKSAQICRDAKRVIIQAEVGHWDDQGSYQDQGRWVTKVVKIDQGYYDSRPAQRTVYKPVFAGYDGGSGTALYVQVPTVEWGYEQVWVPKIVYQQQQVWQSSNVWVPKRVWIVDSEAVTEERCAKYFAAPNPPDALRISASGGFVVIRVAAPRASQKPITGYQWRVQVPGQRWRPWSSAVNKRVFKVKAMALHKHYKIQVRAVSAAGVSVAVGASM